MQYFVTSLANNDVLDEKVAIVFFLPSFEKSSRLGFSKSVFVCIKSV